MLVFSKYLEEASALDPLLETICRWLAGHANCIAPTLIKCLIFCFGTLSLDLPSASPTCWGQRKRIKQSTLTLPGNTHLKLMALQRCWPAVYYFSGNLCLVSNKTLSVMGSLRFPKTGALFFICVLCFLAKHCITTRESLQECSSILGWKINILGILQVFPKQAIYPQQGQN